MGITLQKIAGGFLLALILIVGLNLGVDAIFSSGGPLVQGTPKPVLEGAAKPEAESGGATAPAPAATSAASAASGSPGPAADQPLARRLAAASAERGQTVARKCQSCHNMAEGAGAKVGPNLYGVVGRPKASVAGFAYSDALKGLGGAWSYEDLDKFLTRPGAFAAGTKMTFAGLPDAQERADVITYLRSLSPQAPPLPQ